MYNRYIPENTDYTWVGEESKPAWTPNRGTRSASRPGTTSAPGGRAASGHTGTRDGTSSQSHTGKTGSNGLFGSAFWNGSEGLSALWKGKRAEGLSGLLKGLKLDEVDTGDILLLLIVLYLLVEGDDLELVIALGLVLLMGLGGDKEAEDS